MASANLHGQDFGYTTNNGTLTVSAYNGPGGDVVIPSSFAGLPIVAIGDSAFAYNSFITSVVISPPVTSIGVQSFARCSRLSSVTIPEGGVKGIGEGAFAMCDNLKSVNLPEGMLSVQSLTFFQCSSLSSITIPSTLTMIGSRAFNGCSSISNITIGANIFSIGEDAFAGCIGLTALEVNPSNSVYSSVGGALFNKAQSLLIQYPGGKEGDFIIPSSVIDIADHAFQSCVGLTGVKISDNITNIGIWAFWGCANLSSVSIPATVTSIDSSAFDNCARLSNISVEALNPVYSSLDGVLFDKSHTKLLRCPAGKTSNYTIPYGTLVIGSDAFSYSASLTNVTIPKTVTSIEVGAFAYCSGLLDIVVPDSIKNIWDAAFRGCANLQSIAIGSGVTNLEYGIFLACFNLKSAYFRGNAPTLARDEFSNTNAIIYYLPGTTGWGPTFSDCRTVLWVPEMQISDNTFVRSNALGLMVFWASGRRIVVEVSTNQPSPTWMPVATNILLSDSFYYNDLQWTNYPSRLYRIRSP